MEKVIVLERSEFSWIFEFNGSNEVFYNNEKLQVSFNDNLVTFTQKTDVVLTKEALLNVIKYYDNSLIKSFKGDSLSNNGNPFQPNECNNTLEMMCDLICENSLKGVNKQESGEVYRVIFGTLDSRGQILNENHSFDAKTLDDKDLKRYILDKFNGLYLGDVYINLVLVDTEDNGIIEDVLFLDLSEIKRDGTRKVMLNYIDEVLKG